MGHCIVLAAILIHTIYAASYCSQFNDCERCAGRHRITFEVCVWCPSTSTCMSPKSGCKGELQEIFDCPRKMEVDYNETFVREVVTTLIGAAQGNYNQIQTCLSTLPGRVQLWKRFSVQTGEGDRSDAFIAVDYHNRAIIASFSSVSSGSNLLYRSFSAEFFTNRQAQFEQSDGLVNRFIYDGWIKLWKILGMESALTKLFDFYSGYEFWVVGHAVGGSKADMTALAVVLKNMIDPEKIRLVTFGSTRVGDISFVEMIETKIPYRFRVVHNQDMIIKYPKPFDGEWTPPIHHRYEVWYPNDMDYGARYYICLGAEDPQCSTGLAPWEARPDDNDVYFQRNLRQWVTRGCEDSDRVVARQPGKYYLLDHPQPKYNFNDLQTARPYITTQPPVTRPPGAITTPRITKPIIVQTTTRPPAMITPTTKATLITAGHTVNQPLPWWFTTRAWSTTQITTTTVPPRPAPEIKAVETKKKLKTPSQDKQDSWWIAPKDAKRDLSEVSAGKPIEKRPFLDQGNRFRGFRPAKEPIGTFTTHQKRNPRPVPKIHLAKPAIRTGAEHRGPEWDHTRRQPTTSGWTTVEKSTVASTGGPKRDRELKGLRRITGKPQESRRHRREAVAKQATIIASSAEIPALSNKMETIIQGHATFHRRDSGESCETDEIDD